MPTQTNNTTHKPLHGPRDGSEARARTPPPPRAAAAVMSDERAVWTRRERTHQTSCVRRPPRRRARVSERADTRSPERRQRPARERKRESEGRWARGGRGRGAASTPRHTPHAAAPPTLRHPSSSIRTNLFNFLHSPTPRGSPPGTRHTTAPLHPSEQIVKRPPLSAPSPTEHDAPRCAGAALPGRRPRRRGPRVHDYGQNERDEARCCR